MQLDIEMWTGDQQVWTCYTEHEGRRYVADHADPRDAAAALLDMVHARRDEKRPPREEQ